MLYFKINKGCLIVDILNCICTRTYFITYALFSIFDHYIKVNIVLVFVKYNTIKNYVVYH